MKVAIVGGGSVNPYEILRYGRDWEVWGLNAIRPPWAYTLKWARWFNLHRWEHLKRDWAEGLRKEIAWAQRHPSVPFYVVDSWRAGTLPNEKIFPAARLARAPRGTYHAGSFDWLVAFAVSLGARVIALHGVGLALDSPREEPISARACLEYWCGYAAGKGVKIIAGSDCDIFYQYHLVRSHTIYGYDDVRLVEEQRR